MEFSLVRKITFSIWFISLIVWNYTFPGAAPWEDVFVGVGLYFAKKTSEQYLDE